MWGVSFMRKKRTKIVTIALLCAGLSCSFVPFKDKRYVEYFLYLYAADKFREQGFTLRSMRPYYSATYIDRIEIQFDSFITMNTIADARVFLVNAAEDFLKVINNDPLLIEKGLLPGGHFCARQLKLVIRTQNIFAEKIDVVGIKSITLENEVVAYETYKDPSWLRCASHVTREPYLEAVAFAASQPLKPAGPEIIGEVNRAVAELRQQKEQEREAEAARLQAKQHAEQQKAMQHTIENFSALMVPSVPIKEEKIPLATVNQLQGAIAPSAPSEPQKVLVPQMPSQMAPEPTSPKTIRILEPANTEQETQPAVPQGALSFAESGRSESSDGVEGGSAPDAQQPPQEVIEAPPPLHEQQVPSSAYGPQEESYPGFPQYHFDTPEAMPGGREETTPSSVGPQRGQYNEAAPDQLAPQRDQYEEARPAQLREQEISLSSLFSTLLKSQELKAEVQEQEKRKQQLAQQIQDAELQQKALAYVDQGEINRQEALKADILREERRREEQRQADQHQEERRQAQEQAIKQQQIEAEERQRAIREQQIQNQQIQEEERQRAIRNQQIQEEERAKEAALKWLTAKSEQLYQDLEQIKIPDMVAYVDQGEINRQEAIRADIRRQEERRQEERRQAQQQAIRQQQIQEQQIQAEERQRAIRNQQIQEEERQRAIRNQQIQEEERAKEAALAWLTAKSEQLYQDLEQIKVPDMVAYVDQGEINREEDIREEIRHQEDEQQVRDEAIRQQQIQNQQIQEEERQRAIRNQQIQEEERAKEAALEWFTSLYQQHKSPVEEGEKYIAQTEVALETRPEPLVEEEALATPEKEDSAIEHLRSDTVVEQREEVQQWVQSLFKRKG